MWEIAGRREC